MSQAEPEQWEAVPGREGQYEVSDRGRVRSLDKIIYDRGRAGCFRARHHAGRILKPTNGGTRGGHLKVALGRRSREWVHRLVWIAFRGKPPPGLHVCHEDNDATNNWLSNLRLDTPTGNAADRRRHGTHQQGEDHPGSILTEDDVREIRFLSDSGVSRKEVGAFFGVHGNTITNIVKGRTWGWLQ